MLTHSFNQIIMDQLQCARHVLVLRAGQAGSGPRAPPPTPAHPSFLWTVLHNDAIPGLGVCVCLWPDFCPRN